MMARWGLPYKPYKFYLIVSEPYINHYKSINKNMILPILAINKRSDPLLQFPQGVSALQQGRNEVAAAPCDLCVLQGHWALVEGLLGTPVEVGKAMILGSELDFKYFNLHRPSKMAFFLNRTDMKSGDSFPASKVSPSKAG